MDIAWNLYDALERLPTMDAAFLWNEIEPTRELLQSPPRHVQLRYGWIKREVEKLRLPGKTTPMLQNPFPRSGMFFEIEEWARVEYVYRSELTKLANDSGVKPKLLFPEVREKEANDGWNKGDVGKKKYQELIYVLCKALNIDPTSKDATSIILQKAEEAGSGISDATIRKILDEVDPASLLRSNRRRRKTK